MLSLCLLLSSSPLLARTLVVLSGDAEVYHNVAVALRVQLRDSSEVLTLEQLRQDPPAGLAQSDTLVAVGAAAFEQLLQLPPERHRLLATFIPESTYHALLARHGEAWRQKPGLLSAIYLDQPLRRQLQLARLVVPKARRIGTALGPATRHQLAELQAEAKSLNFELVHAELSADDNPVRRLQPIIERSDLFLPLPDQAVFNRTTAKWILYIAYRKRVPLIGFSRKYVEAGAVAGVYSSATQIGRQSAELLNDRADKRAPLPPPQFPKYYSVITNRVAARTLQLELPTDAALEARLQEMSP
ncbi:ABC transporter substrate-binding protein [Marinobacterium arenosum]|uniref:ABC transporter substrate-binding protein n=1 Tax=Marinobacterium arenosum TaxID=2862496 RepID=UPI001C95A54A|nr:ABC transporter substrate binding protein [Marinobacterium arenosum]